MGTIGGKCKLRHNKNFTVYIKKALIHLTVFILKNTKNWYLFYKFICVIFSVAVNHAKENHKALLTFSDYFIIYLYGCILYSLNYCFHICPLRITSLDKVNAVNLIKKFNYCIEMFFIIYRNRHRGKTITVVNRSGVY